MERRDFLKISAITTGAMLTSNPLSALAETMGSEETGMAESRPEGGYVPNPKIARKIEGCGPMDIRKLKIKVGAKRPFSMLHISDSHLVLTDSRNDEKKAQLAKFRNREFPWAVLYHERLIAYARENRLPIIHTGDMIDFLSEMGLDYAVEAFSHGEWITSCGNHEFANYMGWFGPEKEDAEFQSRYFAQVQEAFPDNLTFTARVINGVNFITLDDSFYFITQEQWNNVAAEFAKGLPVVMMMHIPFYTPKLYDHTSHGGTKFSYLCGAPSDTEREDNLTQQFVKWLKEQPQLKAILTGHLHEFWQEQFSPTAVQYVVGGAFRGDAYHIKFV